MSIYVLWPATRRLKPPAAPAHLRLTAYCRNAAAALVKSAVVLTMANHRAKLGAKLAFIPVNGSVEPPLLPAPRSRARV